ncbi:MAG: helix-turn-helix transcriptional regulator [Lachnospiraceae bacterium]|nr:helix-turn-helix transcriptional regulator [Lachnospiraceae bacterium]
MEPVVSFEPPIEESDAVLSRVRLLRAFLNCNGVMFISCCNSEGELLEDNLSHSVYDTFLRHSKLFDELLAHCREKDNPLVLSAEMGLLWSAVSERNEDGSLRRIFIMGPVTTTAISAEALRDLNWNPVIPVSWKPKLRQYLAELPTIPATDFYKYTLMLHYAVSDVYLKYSNLSFVNVADSKASSDENAAFSASEYYAIETSLLEFIRTGDIYYKQKISSAASIMDRISVMAGGRLSAIRQHANIFCGFCIRAAVEGGVSCDTAYQRGRVYLDQIESARSAANITSACYTLFEDLLFSVHNHKTRPECSELISACIDMIETHTDDPLSIDYLAEQMSYNKYYLSKRFKAETGYSVNSYVKKARIERASYLLVSTNMSIQDISDLLLFGNRNFFTKTFKEYTGKNPAEFREAHKKH